MERRALPATCIGLARGLAKHRKFPFRPHLWKTVGRQRDAASHPAGMATKEFDMLP